MNHDLNQIERLDWAAKALVSEQVSSWGQIYTAIWSPLIADWSHLAPRREVAYIAGAVAALVTLMLWRRHRYSILALAMVEITAGGAFLYIGLQNNHDHWWQAFNFTLVPVLVYGGIKRIKEGTQFLAVQGEEWAAERVQVRRWLGALQWMASDDKVIEIKDQTVWKTRVTYRFLNTGNCWAMAKFKAGQEKKLPTEYRIRFLSEIAFTEGPGGATSAQVDSKTIPRGLHFWD
jgi:uncharacterized membrane protein YjdF